MPHRTHWFQQAGWGVNVVFMEGVDERAPTRVPTSAEAWNARVDSFDVPGLTAQLVELEAPYLFFTLGQNSGHYCAPNATYDRLVGRDPSLCARRDLVAELADALAPHGIKLLLYLPSGAATCDPLARERLEWEWGYETPWPNGFVDELRTGRRLEGFQTKWEAVCREWALRYGTGVAGWWIDGCYFADEMYRNPKAPNFGSFAQALRAGNPDALVAFNPGQIAPLIIHSNEDDYTCGEISTEFPLCPGRWVQQGKHVAQWHVYSWIGTGWGGGECARLPLEFVIGYTKQAMTNGGVVTWDAPVDAQGRFKPHFFELLKAVRQAIPRR
jgi:hypothetical protein